MLTIIRDPVYNAEALKLKANTQISRDYIVSYYFRSTANLVLCIQQTVQQLMLYINKKQVLYLNKCDLLSTSCIIPYAINSISAAATNATNTSTNITYS